MSISSRQQLSKAVRNNAAALAAQRPHPVHRNNGEEQRYRRGKRLLERSYIANFTKGLPHEEKTGLLLNPADYRQFILGIQSGDSNDFKATPLGPGVLHANKACLSQQKIDCDTADTSAIWLSQIAKEHVPCGANNKGAGLRAWESQGAGLIYGLEGPDAQAVTMPPAPVLDSPELAAEIAEVYLMALLRDTHVSQLRNPAMGPQLDADLGEACKCPPIITVPQTMSMLDNIMIDGKNWFQLNCCELNDDERKRHRDMSYLSLQRLFRGLNPGDDAGPYLSQFLLIGNEGVNCKDKIHKVADGQVAYGSLRVDQKVRYVQPCKDYMTTYEAWLDVQNAADVSKREDYLAKPPYRFITTLRDMATYVHYDALYESYLNACLILQGLGAPLDHGLPFQGPDVEDKQQGFVSFGGPHILTLVTEVATRALKAVRYQKYNTHRRLRPEALGGLIDRFTSGIEQNGELKPITPLVKALDSVGLLDAVAKHNACQNAVHADRQADASGNATRHLLPIAFPEGSPMHPSYGAGHATVAGACVTILKAFFDHGWALVDEAANPIAFEPNADGSALVGVAVREPLTVEGELNKLAANISIGRDWAGVHYFTDYIESLRMGEQIALGILEEQKLTYGENFTMTVPLFDGSTVRI